MTISTQEVQKLLLEWKEELNKEKQRKIQADAVSQDAAVKINMIDGALQFGEMLLKKPEPTGVVDIGTKGTSKRTKQ
tara:strand:- start:350 stop:580 length:231 start_codon:yes stop_codon:yes gene_type:complete